MLERGQIVLRMLDVEHIIFFFSKFGHGTALGREMRVENMLRKQIS
jgi:hypothetical protein